MRLRACPALRAARFRRGSEASGGRAGAFGGERPRSSQGACPFAAVFRERQGEERENAARALEAVGWFPPGGAFAARFAGDGRRLRGGSRWGGTGAFAFWGMRLRFGGCPFLLRREESFVDGCGDGGPGKGRALFLHAAFDGTFRVGCGQMAPSGGFFLRVSRGTGGVCAEGPGGEGRARSPLGGCACTPGHARSFCGAKSRSLMAAGMAGQGKAARSFRTRLLMGLSALEAVGWLSPGPFLLRVSRRTGRRSRGGSRWGGTGTFAFGRMRLRPGNARFFCGAKSRSLVAAGMAGQGKGRALFLHAAF